MCVSEVCISLNVIFIIQVTVQKIKSIIFNGYMLSSSNVLTGFLIPLSENFPKWSVLGWGTHNTVVPQAHRSISVCFGKASSFLKDELLAEERCIYCLNMYCQSKVLLSKACTAMSVRTAMEQGTHSAIICHLRFSFQTRKAVYIVFGPFEAHCCCLPLILYKCDHVGAALW